MFGEKSRNQAGGGPPDAPGEEAAPLPSAAGCDLGAFPQFKVAADDVDVLYDPADFREWLVTSYARAKRRVGLAALYIGAAEPEREIVRSIEQACERRLGAWRIGETGAGVPPAAPAAAAQDPALSPAPLSVSIVIDSARGRRIEGKAVGGVAGESSVSVLQNLLLLKRECQAQFAPATVAAGAAPGAAEAPAAAAAASKAAAASAAAAAPSGGGSQLCHGFGGLVSRRVPSETGSLSSNGDGGLSTATTTASLEEREPAVGGRGIAAGAPGEDANGAAGDVGGASEASTGDDVYGDFEDGPHSMLVGSSIRPAGGGSGGSAASGSGPEHNLLCPVRPCAPLDISIGLFHSPLLSGVLYRLLPPRVNEILGVFHTKIFIADDSVLISGANLSASYLTDRQDRYVVIKNSKPFVDFLFGLLRLLESFSWAAELPPTQEAAAGLRPMEKRNLYQRLRGRDEDGHLQVVEIPAAADGGRELAANISGAARSGQPPPPGPLPLSPPYRTPAAGTPLISPRGGAEAAAASAAPPAADGSAADLCLLRWRNPSCPSPVSDPVIFGKMFGRELLRYLRTADPVVAGAGGGGGGVAGSAIVTVAVQAGFCEPPLQQEEEVLRRYLSRGVGSRIVLASGYLNMTDEMLATIAQEGVPPDGAAPASDANPDSAASDAAQVASRKLEVYVAAPEANSFHQSRGLSKYIPMAYSYMGGHQLLRLQEGLTRQRGALQRSRACAERGSFSLMFKFVGAVILGLYCEVRDACIRAFARACTRIFAPADGAAAAANGENDFVARMQCLEKSTRRSTTRPTLRTLFQRRRREQIGGWGEAREPLWGGAGAAAAAAAGPAAAAAAVGSSPAVSVISSRPAPSPMTFCEYRRPNWTFHSKGLWMFADEGGAPLATVVGSSNFGHRSRVRDFDVSFLVETADAGLRQKLAREVHLLRASSAQIRDVTTLMRRCPGWLAFLLKHTKLKTLL